ncbi:MAG TPA: Trm112 family protein [Candidatus Azosocius sp. HAIN]
MNFILACPFCYKKLFYNKNHNKLFCDNDNVIYFIIDDIPVIM